MEPGDCVHCGTASKGTPRHPKGNIGTFLSESLATPDEVFDAVDRVTNHRLVRKLEGRPGILVAMDETDLAARTAEGLALKDWTAVQSQTARQLHTALAAFIEARPL